MAFKGDSCPLGSRSRPSRIPGLSGRRSRLLTKMADSSASAWSAAGECQVIAGLQGGQEAHSRPQELGLRRWRASLWPVA
jgi:hypothetical protein